MFRTWALAGTAGCGSGQRSTPPGAQALFHLHSSPLPAAPVGWRQWVTKPRLLLCKVTALWNTARCGGEVGAPWAAGPLPCVTLPGLSAPQTSLLRGGPPILQLGHLPGGGGQSQAEESMSAGSPRAEGPRPSLGGRWRPNAALASKLRPSRGFPADPGSRRQVTRSAGSKSLPGIRATFSFFSGACCAPSGWNLNAISISYD